MRVATISRQLSALSDEVSGGLGTTALIGVGIFLITALINTLSIRHKVHSLRLFAKA